MPIDSLKPAFMAALEATHVLVEAPTGSGKSSRPPIWCAEQDRELHPENLEVEVSYEPRKRRITLQRRRGTRRSPPLSRELPAWPGWSVRYRHGSRLVDIR